MARDVTAVEHHRSRVRSEEPGDRVEQRRFPDPFGPIRPSVTTPGLILHRYAVEGPQSGRKLYQPDNFESAGCGAIIGLLPRPWPTSLVSGEACLVGSRIADRSRPEQTTWPEQQYHDQDEPAGHPADWP